jgi:hypothetical protein
MKNTSHLVNAVCTSFLAAIFASLSLSVTQADEGVLNLQKTVQTRHHRPAER